MHHYLLIAYNIYNKICILLFLTVYNLLNGIINKLKLRTESYINSLSHTMINKYNEFQ